LAVIYGGEPRADAGALLLTFDAMAITRAASRNMAGLMTWPFNTGVFVPLLFTAAITARACITASGEGVADTSK
jgi:hypothetical protein